LTRTVDFCTALIEVLYKSNKDIAQHIYVIGILEPAKEFLRAVGVRLAVRSGLVPPFLLTPLTQRHCATSNPDNTFGRVGIDCGENRKGG
jgi:hypothetical protein